MMNTSASHWIHFLESRLEKTQIPDFLYQKPLNTFFSSSVVRFTGFLRIAASSCAR
jgi:hypothetical protein